MPLSMSPTAGVKNSFPNSNTKFEIGRGFFFCPVSSRVATVIGPGTPKSGWRCVYIGFNTQAELARWNWSGFRKLLDPLPNVKYEVRPARRMNKFGYQWKQEIKVGGDYPTPFWGKEGKLLLLDLAAYLDTTGHCITFHDRILDRDTNSPAEMVNVHLNGTFVLTALKSEQQFIREFVASLAGLPAAKVRQHLLHRFYPMG